MPGACFRFVAFVGWWGAAFLKVLRVELSLGKHHKASLQRERQRVVCVSVRLRPLGLGQPNEGVARRRMKIGAHSIQKAQNKAYQSKAKKGGGQALARPNGSARERRSCFGRMAASLPLAFLRPSSRARVAWQRRREKQPHPIKGGSFVKCIGRRAGLGRSSEGASVLVLMRAWIDRNSRHPFCIARF